MPPRKRSPKQIVPARLEKVRQQFERSRRKRKPRSPIPDRLWTEAVKMAQQYGIHRTAKTLHLDYYSLKKRVEQKDTDHKRVSKTRKPSSKTRSTTAESHATAAPNAVATFFEVVPSAPSAGSCECTLEWEDAGGARMRVHMKGFPAPDLIALSKSFWGLEG